MVRVEMLAREARLDLARPSGLDLLQVDLRVRADRFLPRGGCPGPYIRFRRNRLGRPRPFIPRQLPGTPGWREPDALALAHSASGAKEEATLCERGRLVVVEGPPPELSRLCKARFSHYVFPAGRVLTTDDFRGANVELPPGGWKMTMPLSGAIGPVRVFGIRLLRASRTQVFFERNHLQEPHYYIRTLGVVTRFQGFERRGAPERSRAELFPGRTGANPRLRFARPVRPLLVTRFSLSA